MYRFLLPFIPSLSSDRIQPLRLLLIAGIAALLACCSSTSRAPQGPWSNQQAQLEQLDNWELRGRVNVLYKSESHTPRLMWQKADDEYQIRLWGTFNAGATNIWGRPGMVSLEQDGRISTARRPEDLILDAVGYEFPVSYLEYWIKGLPAPDGRARMDFTDKGALQAMEQAGWTVNYTDLRQYGALSLPRDVEVSRKEDDVRLRFVGLNWSLAGN